MNDKTIFQKVGKLVTEIQKRSRTRDDLLVELLAANQRIEALEGALRNARKAMQLSVVNHGCDPCHLTEAIDGADEALAHAAEVGPKGDK